MRRLALLPLCLLLGAAHAADDQKDLAYSMGAKIGERLRAEAPGLPLDELLRGLSRTYKGEKPELDPARMEKLLEHHEASLEQAGSSTKRAQTAEKYFLALERGKYGVKELPGGILVTELRHGSGPKPSANGQVRVTYRGQLADGSVFDESSTPQWFRLDNVIAGWREALQQMPVGARWRLVIPSGKAYGAEGAGDVIPPHAPLVFELELLETK
ncbi:FKBP-type peptidyl-prolyl cis-trans isomerase [Metapseudomonas otitidis]|uniref:FKBP-type peptidyl-prolyl cis-trans isomerase n=1 Tax=Metapseudomonas otitidis TaxID=319939 RepID=UPI003CF9A6D6